MWADPEEVTMAGIIVLISVFFFLSIEAIGLLLKRRRGEETAPATVHAFSDIHLPRGLFVGDGHAWARLTESGELKLGADEFVTQAMGGADRVELPEVGTQVAAGQPLATVWRLGRKIAIPSPVNGTVVATNETVERAPTALEADPYGAGWLAMVWPSEVTEALKSLRVGERAHKWLENEVQRFTEFLARRMSPEMVGATLPDGARPVKGAALALDDEAWNEFEKEFLHTRNT